MSDLRVDTRAILDAYLTTPASRDDWAVMPIWHPKAKGDFALTTPDQASGDVKKAVAGVLRIFEAATMKEHREAVEVLSTAGLLWDGPPILLTNKGHVRLAAYLFKYLAHVSVVPTAVAVSEPRPGRTLIELDAVAASRPHRAWFVPASLLLPAQVSKSVHLKIGVNSGGDGKVELLIGRLTNLPPFLPRVLRAANGVLLGAVPHALEAPLGFAFDAFDGGDYYARKREAQFRARHPDSQNVWRDAAVDLLHDVPAWGREQLVIASESLQALFGHSFARLSETAAHVVAFYAWLFNAALSLLGSGAEAVTHAAAGTSASFGDAVGSAVDGARGAIGGFSPASAAAGGGGAAGTTAAGGGAKAYKGPSPTAATAAHQPRAVTTAAK